MQRVQIVTKYFRPSISYRTLSNSTPKQSRSAGGPGKWLILSIPAATFCLGTWQVQRRDWKNALIEKINLRTSMDPIPLPEICSEKDLDDMEYSKFIVEGEFDHFKEIYLRPRMAVTPRNQKDGGSLISTSPRVGAQVITPFYIPDRGYSILVNRGFVDEKQINPETRQAGQVSGTVSVTGIFRRTETGRMIPSNDPSRGVWKSTNVEEMAQVTGTRPILLEATADSTVSGGPIGGQTRIKLWNQHVSYIITWYSISALTTFMWYTKYMR